MQIDDRLVTVLRQRATGERALRTQYRQLIDLLGNARPGSDTSLRTAAWMRLAELARQIPAEERAAILREPGIRLRQPDLVRNLAEGELQTATAALAKAELPGEAWETLIPQLPLRARGFLRLRRDLPGAAIAVLERLGVHDRGLPHPEPVVPTPANEERPEEPANENQPDSQIGALVKRIERFRRHRPAAGAAPRLPLEGRDAPARTGIQGFDFGLGPDGTVDWAESHVAPYIVGARLEHPRVSRAVRLRQPVEGVAILLAVPNELAGRWQVDAVPRFAEIGGHFLGHAGRLRRIADLPEEAPRAPDTDAGTDRIRQLLHELRTPVTAIQGYAELIQQQVAGELPHAYRALGANIAGDAARMLSGFDEIDRYARLTGRSMQLDEGRTSLREAASLTIAHLEPALKARSARIEFEAEEDAQVALAPHELASLLWRIFAVVANGLGPHETIRASLDCTDRTARLAIALPASLAGDADPFLATAAEAAGSLSASMLGSGFALRLARAEATAAGGAFLREDGALRLTLPECPEDSQEISNSAIDGR
ncbi:histidine kinase dimerization/phospho-acceptor domain-containing protein [Qipengyuania sp. JC766]|uniref:histidine kinase dimerization/phospho-acceptor domain-containing protein n=1 Tax=Qipengyuania sp. JC766 TaxID=3232139 RepID=UPI00345A8712